MYDPHRGRHALGWLKITHTQRRTMHCMRLFATVLCLFSLPLSLSLTRMQHLWYFYNFSPVFSFFLSFPFFCWFFNFVWLFLPSNRAYLISENARGILKVTYLTNSLQKVASSARHMNMTAGQQWLVEEGGGVAWLNENWRHFYKQQKTLLSYWNNFELLPLALIMNKLIKLITHACSTAYICVCVWVCVGAGASAATQTQSPLPSLLCFVSTQIFALPAWKTHKIMRKTRGK